MNNTSSSPRNQIIEEAIKKVASEVIERESNKTAIITITRVELLERGKQANLLLSVLPVEGEESALNFVKRKRKLIRDAVKKMIASHTIPFIDVQIDKGEKARQNIEALLREAQE